MGIGKLLSGLVQTALFLALLTVGSFARPFHLAWHLASNTPGVSRFFVPDGLLLALIALCVILGVETARRRLQAAGPITAVAFSAALLLGFAAKLGFVTRQL